MKDVAWFVSRAAEAANDPVYGVAQLRNREIPQQLWKTVFAADVGTSCIICAGTHTLDSCPKFTKLGPDDKELRS